MDLTFEDFKTQLLSLLVNGHYFDDYMLLRYWDDYKKLNDLPTYNTVKRFAGNYFQDWKKGTHEAWLKSHKELKQENRPSKKPKQIQKIKKFSRYGQNIKNKEAKVMREFWDEHADFMGGGRCMETGQYLRKYHPYYVHHIYTKGANCISRLDKENLVIVSYDTHNVIHTEGEKKLKLYPHFLEVREKMKIKYHNQKQTT